MKTREDLFDVLLELFTNHIKATDALSKWEIDKQIYQALKDGKDIELDFELHENQIYI